MIDLRFVPRLALVTLLAAGAPLAWPSAARGQGPDAQAVQAAVEHFLAVAGNRDVDALTPLLAPQATINVARFRDSRWTHTAQTRAAWVAALRAQAASARFREPLTAVSVHVEDGQLAYLRAHFTIVVDGAIQSHGVDYFTLVNSGGGWQVANLSYTNRPGPPR